MIPTPTLSDLPPPPPGKEGWPWTEAATPEPVAGEAPRITIVTPSFIASSLMRCE